MHMVFTFIHLTAQYSGADLEDPNGVDVGWSRTPATQHDNGRSSEDVAFPLAFVHASNQTLVDILKPVALHFRVIEKRVNTTEQMTL